MSLKTISALSFLVGGAAMLGLLYPSLLSGHLPPAGFVDRYAQSALFGAGPVSIGLQIVGLAVLFWAGVMFRIYGIGPATHINRARLITTGPYKYVRNPMDAGTLLAVWAGIAAHFSLVTIALGAVFTAGVLGRALCQERMMRTIYPKYEEYARKTSRFVPMVW